MKRSTKRIVGWGSGAGIGVTFIVLTFVLIVGINSGSMTNLHGGAILDVVDITPHAGGDEASGDDTCGSYIDWIGHKADKKAIKKTGKTFRILPPGSMMTFDHNPERINIHVDQNGIIEDVKCG